MDIFHKVILLFIGSSLTHKFSNLCWKEMSQIVYTGHCLYKSSLDTAAKILLTFCIACFFLNEIIDSLPNLLQSNFHFYEMISLAPRYNYQGPYPKHF